MFLQRNVAGQVFVIPGTLRVIADGSAVTSGATLTWVKDGTSGASAGTLTHISDGGFSYQPSQGETDAKICGWVLTKTGAAGIAGSIRTTNADPNAGSNLGLTNLPGVVQPQTGDSFARLGAPTGASVSADIATRGTSTLTQAQVTGGAYALATDSSGRVRTAYEIRNGTAQAGAAGSITLDSGAIATDNYYYDCWVLITSGAGAGQVREITGYVGSTKVASVSPNFTTATDATSVFTILPAACVGVDWGNVVNQSTVNAFGATTIQTVTTLASNAIANASFQNNSISSGKIAASATAAIATAVWQDTTAGDFTVASSIGKSLYTSGNAPGAASGIALVGSNMGTITGGTVTTLTNLPAITANWLTSTGINAGALNGKGDWLLASSYTAPTNLTASQIATGVWQDTTAGDFTVAASIGKSLFTSGNVPGAASGLALVGSNVGAATSVTGAVGSVTGNIGGSVGSVVSAVTVGTNNDKTGYELDGAGVTAVQSGLATAASQTTILNRLGAITGTGINTVLGYFRALANKLTALTPSDLTSGGGTFDNTEDSLEAQHDAGASVVVAGYATGQDPATLVLDPAASSHNIAGSIGAKINSAGGAADPLGNAVPGSYAAGTAGYVLGHVGSGSAGNGDTPVTENTGGADNLRAVDNHGNGVGGAFVTAYLTSEWASNPTTATQHGQIITKSDGRFVQPLMINAGLSYTLVYVDQGFQTATKAVTP
jgi:hypothetical protein